MKVINCEQGTPEWHAARAGRVTASRVADMIARTKSGWSTSRAKYRNELVAETLTGRVADDFFMSAAMKWGVDHEGAAADQYAFLTDAALATVGFVVHPDIDRAGASPDRLIGNDGLLEIKCPLTATHINTLLTQEINPDYVLQMQWQMACTGRAWCDFVTFDPRLPAEMQIWMQRVHRDNAVIADLVEQTKAFLGEVEDIVAALRKSYPGA